VSILFLAGGLGIHTFHSAHAGGDYIIQPRLENAAALAALLPEGAPLSTLRVVSASRLSLSPTDTDGTREPEEAASSSEEDSEVQVVSCVWRAGRAGACTDHKAVMFDVDLSSSPPGRIRPGFSNHAWYQLRGWWPLGGWRLLDWRGWRKGARGRDDGTSEEILVHPDTGVRIEGHTIPRMRQVMQLVRLAHKRLVPGVPLVGWDVAIVPAEAKAGGSGAAGEARRRGTTEEDGEGSCRDAGDEEDTVLLLEGNLSCNLFCGSFHYEVCPLSLPLFLCGYSV